MKEETFWQDIVIPFQEEEEDYEFSSVFKVSRYFARSSAMMAYLGQKGEEFTNKEKDLDLRLMQVEAEFRDLRRLILATNYKEITKSASSEIQEAFIYDKAQKAGLLGNYIGLEMSIKDLKKELLETKKKMDYYKHRMTVLRDIHAAGREHLNFEKLIMRISNDS